MDLIFVPCAEPFHLLALPDLYHELAHFLLERYEAELVQPVLELVDEHFDRAVLAAGQNGWPQPSIDAISEAGIAWWNHWCLEFASDMLATYWVGPAFGWANIRVCTNLGDELFVGGSAHPADDARCAAIRFMLEHVGQVDAAASVETVWSELVTLSGQQAPQAYELTYPTDLLRQMARVMSHAAAQMNLVAFDDEDASSKECLSRLLNSAWETFLSAPEAFAAFERTQIESLKSQLGILR
jgi:hypothetical protein